MCLPVDNTHDHQIELYVLQGGPVKCVYNGTADRYLDQDPALQPYTYYEYTITSFNSRGKAQSSWDRVLTREAAPSNILPPKVKVSENTK